jgi:hypothetical protein
MDLDGSKSRVGEIRRGWERERTEEIRQQRQRRECWLGES